MRQHFLIFLSLNLAFIPALVFSLAQVQALENPPLLITEIMYNPAGEDEIILAGRQRNRQWLELHNPTDQLVTITGGLRDKIWTLLDSTGTHFLAKSAWQGAMSIAPGETIILAGDAQVFLQEYQNYTGTVIDAKMELAHDFEFIQLKNEEGKVMAQTPLSNNIGGDGNGKTVELYPDGTAGESEVIGGTPGKYIAQPSKPGFIPPVTASPSPIIPIEIIEPSPLPEDYLTSGRVVINEISGGAQRKWLELKNLERYGISLTGWKIKAISTNQTLVLKQKIQAQGIVLISDLEKKISLSGKAEKIQLFDSNNNLVFQVEYKSSLPLD